MEKRKFLVNHHPIVHKSLDMSVNTSGKMEKHTYFSSLVAPRSSTVQQDLLHRSQLERLRLVAPTSQHV
jgi:hypothetical protein